LLVVADERGIDIDRGVGDEDLSYRVLWIMMLLAGVGVESSRASILSATPSSVQLDWSHLLTSGKAGAVLSIVGWDLLEGAQQVRRAVFFVARKLVHLDVGGVGGNEAQTTKGINRDLPVQKPVEYVGVEHVGGHLQ
jgi:hypothetical protein